MFLHETDGNYFLLLAVCTLHSEVVLRVGLEAVEIVQTSTSIFSWNPFSVPLTFIKLLSRLEKYRERLKTLVD